MSIERKSDYWLSLTQSVVLHGLVVGALAYGFYTYKKQPTAVQPTLAVEAALVDSAGDPVEAPAQPAPPPPAPEPAPEPEPEPPPPPEEIGPPAPTPEEIQQREQAQLEEQQKLEQQQREQEERVALERKQAEEKAAAEEKQRREEAERKRQQEEREAEQKRVAEAKRKAEEKRKADEARLQAQRDAELRRTLEAEERLSAARSSPAYASWQAAIVARVTRAWIRPPGASAGLNCIVRISQTPGGEVTSVQLGECNADGAVRESIESAVYRASPLPPPPDPALFERNITFVFKPID
jgi:colicin import membrane protein